MAGARGIEPRSRVLETLILAVVLCPSNLTYYRRAYPSQARQNLLYI